MCPVWKCHIQNNVRLADLSVPSPESFVGSYKEHKILLPYKLLLVKSRFKCNWLKVSVWVSWGKGEVLRGLYYDPSVVLTWFRQGPPSASCDFEKLFSSPQVIKCIFVVVCSFLCSQVLWSLSNQIMFF